MIRRLLAALALFALALGTQAAAQTFNQRASVNFSSAGPNTLIASSGTTQIYVYGFDLTVASSTTFQLNCGSTALMGPMTLNAYSKAVIQGPAYWVCPAGSSFTATLGSAVQLSGTIWYSQQ